MNQANTSHSAGDARALWHRGAAVALAVVLAAGLAACDKKPGEPTAGQKLDTAVEKTEAAANEAKQKMESAAQDASQAAQNAASNAAAVLDDTAVTTQVKAAFAADPNLSAVLLNVDTKDGVVTLNGPAPSAAAKSRAETIAKGVKGVKSVSNNLAVKG